MVQCKYCRKQLLFFGDKYICKHCGSVLCLQEYSLVWKEKYIKVIK